MNKIKMYSFYDKKSDRYDTPFFTFDEVGAKRHFIMSIQKKGTLMNTFKDDYNLVYITDFCIDDGALSYETIDKKPVPQIKTKTIMEGKQISINKDSD